MFVCFDLETTGLSVDKGAEVVEFSYILFDSTNSFVKAEQLFFYHKGMNWSEEAYNVHQIPLSFLKTQEDKFKGNLIKMYSILNYANVIGHNSTKFDCPFAEKWLARMGLPGLVYGIQHDTMVDFRPVTKRARIKLTTLADMRGYTPDIVSKMETIWFGDTAMPNRPHSGAYDVTATALLALDGIRNDLFSFDQTTKKKVVLTEEDLALLENDKAKPVDPNKLMVIYDENGETNFVYVNHDREQYTTMPVTASDVTQCEKEHRLIPVHMTLTDDDYYSYVGDNFTIEYHQGYAPGDYVIIKTAFGEMRDTEMNICAFIENNFKGVDYV